jgi:hypothetical protein
MPLIVKDRVKETSTTTGTGTLTLAGAAVGFETFSASIGNANTTYYAIVGGAEFEVGLGTVSAGTLARTTVLQSSNADALVNFSAGSKDVFCTYPADKAVYLDGSGNVGALGTITSGVGTALTGVAKLTANTFTGAQTGGVTSLTSTAASIAINLATNNNFSHTTTENTTLAAPSSPVAGQSGVIVITQGATARTLAYNTFYKFAGGTVPALTATASAVDSFAYYVESATRATCQLIKDVK